MSVSAEDAAFRAVEKEAGITPAVEKEVIVQAAKTNGLGTAGFIVSLLGLFLTCGLLCPIGLLFSGMAMFHKPRGMAFAGSVLGGLGSLWVVGVGMVVAAGLVGGVSVYQTGAAIVNGTQKIEDYKKENGHYPEYIAGNELLEGVHDGWNNRVRYHLEENRVFVTSAGPDGEFDTEDDISNNDKAAADGGGGGVFAQLNEALGKMNKPAEGGDEIGDLLGQAMGGGAPAGGGGQPDFGIPEGMPKIAPPPPGAGSGLPPGF